MITLLALFLGICTGICTGLIPGIHTNLITTILITLPIITQLPTNILLIYITSLAITHTFVDFIPTIYFSSPSPDTGLSMTPGHQLLLTGNGHLAINNTIKGSILAIIVFIMITPLFFLILPKISSFVNIMTPWILFWILIFLILKEQRKKEIIIIIILTGFLGIFSLNSNINQPLLPLLTGLFGSSTLIVSIKNKTNPPKQKINKSTPTFKQIKNIFLQTLAISPFCSLLPGLGASQAAALAQKKRKDAQTTLILLGSINTLVLATSFVTLYLINKKRSGTAEAISQLTYLTSTHLKIIIITILITAIIASIVTNIISKQIAKKLHKINYTNISKIILLITTLLILIISKFEGLIILLTATFIGILAIKLNAPKTYLMSSIIIPTILYYIPF